MMLQIPYIIIVHLTLGWEADITGITTNEKLADQYASNCVLALPLVGSTSDVSASIACTSTTKSVTNQMLLHLPRQAIFIVEVLILMAAGDYLIFNSAFLECIGNW